MEDAGSILTMSDGSKYMIIMSSVYNNKKYAYITNVNNVDDKKVCIYENDVLAEITDEDFANEIKLVLTEEFLKSDKQSIA